MFGMGLGLTVQDFVRLFEAPKAILAGLIGQLLVMPLVALAVAEAMALPPAMAIGLMLLSACPGGTMSNVISQLARADLALSLTLTAFSTLICVLYTPFIIDKAIIHFGADELESFSLWGTTLALILVTLLPVAAGILMRHYRRVVADTLEPIFRKFSGIFMIFMIIAILIQERQQLLSSFDAMFVATLSLNLLTILTGLALGFLFALRGAQILTLGIEVGIQNASMAILIAISFLKAPEFAVSAGVYGITMYLGAGMLVLLSRHSSFRA